MRIPFKNPLLQGQWLRTIGHASSGGADLGEGLAIAERIREGDGESWRGAWSGFADALASEAQADLRRGRRRSAHEGYLRAANYYRAATLFDLQPGAAERLRAGYRLHREAFRGALAARDGWAEPIGIPFEGALLPGYVFKAAGEGPKPTLIVTGGYDSTAEELYHYSGPAALARGYNLVCYDGPGQGGALAEQGLIFRPDWETVLAAVIEAIAGRPEVDRRQIALLGISFGGHLAPRAATGSTDLAALIADPGQFSLLEEMRTRLPGALARALPDGDRFRLGVVERLVNLRRGHLTGGWAIRRGMLTHGVERPIDYLKLTAQYTLEGRVERIRCPTFIASAEADAIGATARKLYDRLVCPKVFERFTVVRGAGEHCEAGARGAFNRRLFGWLDDRMAALAGVDSPRAFADA